MVALSVLVLEDHPFQRTAAVSAVKRLGVSDVLAAADGNEALELIRLAGCPSRYRHMRPSDGWDGRR